MLLLGFIVLVIGVVVTLAVEGYVPPLPAASLLSFGVIVSGVAWSHMANVARRRRAAHVLSYLEQALQNNLPLPRIFGALAEEDRSMAGGRRFAIQMSKVREQLESGAPLAVALSEVSGIQLRLLDLVAAAERVGRLPEVLTRVFQQRRDEIARRREGASFSYVYPFVVLTVFVFITTMFMIFVLPKYETICVDFGIKLPWVTQITMDIANTVGVWIYVLLGISLMAMTYIASRSRHGWPEMEADAGPGAWLRDRIPLLSRIRAYDALGNVLNFTADAVDAGRPIDSALAEAAQVSGNVPIQRKVAAWTSALLRGHDLSEAARFADMPPLVCGMLAAAVRTSGTAQVFRFLGRYYATRFSRARELLRAAMDPVIALTLGLAAMWLALSMFMPLIALIQSIALQGSDRL